jgi:putative transposase
LAQAIEAEAEAFLAKMEDRLPPDGRDRLVRHGHGPERLVQTGVGPVGVRRVTLRDRGAEDDGGRIRFTSAILPRWSRRTHSLDALLPILYLRGISMGDFQEALGALLGKDAPNLLPSVIARLRGAWGPITQVGKSATSQPGATSMFGTMASIRLSTGTDEAAGPQADCMLVLIGATSEGKKELLGFQVGGGRAGKCAKLAGAVGRPQGAWSPPCAGACNRRWSARLPEGPEEVSPITRHQRCAVHKTATVLDKLPKSVQPAAKADLREVWNAPDRATAATAITPFADKYGAKYEKAVTCLLTF